MKPTQPLLTTARFELRYPDVSSLSKHCRLLADEQTRRYLGRPSADPAGQFDRLLRNAGSWRLYGYGLFEVYRPHESSLIASCGIFHSFRGFDPDVRMDDVPEAGWIVRADHCGQGIAREVMEAVLHWFDFAHGHKRIACMIEEGNIPSERLAHSLGFHRYGSHIIESDEPATRLNLFERLPQTSD